MTLVQRREAERLRLNANACGDIPLDPLERLCDGRDGGSISHIDDLFLELKEIRTDKWLDELTDGGISAKVRENRKLYNALAEVALLLETAAWHTGDISNADVSEAQRKLRAIYDDPLGVVYGKRSPQKRVDSETTTAEVLQTLKVQGDRIEKTAVETRQGVGVLVQHLPDAKKPPHIEEAEAVAIMKRKGGDMTDRTLRNWLKAGKAGRVKTPISWDDLATVASWSAWVDAYLAAETTRLSRKSFISSRAGKTQVEKSRRQSPTA